MNNEEAETTSVTGIMNENTTTTTQPMVQAQSRPRSVSAAPRITPQQEDMRTPEDELKRTTMSSQKGTPTSRVSLSMDPTFDFMDKQHAHEYGRNRESYSLIREIGKGRGSTVWFASAKLPHKRQPVAIKRFDLEGNHWNNKKLSVNHLDNLIQEVNNMKTCEHTNIARLLSVFVHDMELWIVIELCDAGSVLDLLHDTGQDDGLEEEDLIATVLLDVLKALEYIHKQHIIHRDLKASNILINSVGEVKITDFGYSGVLLDGGQVKYQTSSFIGSTHWMAPEVMQQNGSYSYAADIWSFGITALEIANGKTPTDDDTNLKLYVKVINEPAPALEDTPFKKFSPQFKDMISQCLNKDPTKRPTATKLMQHPFFKKAKNAAYIKEKLVDHSQTIEKRGVSMRSSLKLLRPPEEARNSSSNSITEWIFDFNKEMKHHQHDDPTNKTQNDAPGEVSPVNSVTSTTSSNQSFAQVVSTTSSTTSEPTTRREKTHQNKKSSQKNNKLAHVPQKKKPNGKSKHRQLFLDFQVDGETVQRPVTKRGNKYTYVNRNGNVNYANEKKKSQLYFEDENNQRVYINQPEKLKNGKAAIQPPPTSKKNKEGANNDAEHMPVDDQDPEYSDDAVPLSSSIATSGTGRKFQVEDASLKEIIQISNQRKPNKNDKISKMMDLLQVIQNTQQQMFHQQQRMYIDTPNSKTRVYRGKKPTSMFRMDNNNKVMLRDEERDQVYYSTETPDNENEIGKLLNYIDSLETKVQVLQSKLQYGEKKSPRLATSTTTGTNSDTKKSPRVPPANPFQNQPPTRTSPTNRPIPSTTPPPGMQQRTPLKVTQQQPADAFADVDVVVKNMFNVNP